MLPGFRTLAAIIVLAVAIVTFALGAAALLRVAHEDFATLQTWRPAIDALPDTIARREPAMPTLAALRIEPDPAITEQIVSPPAPAAIPEPAPIEVRIAPRPPEPQTPPTVVAALPAKPDLQLPNALYNRPRTGPRLMPEIATNDAPPVAVASLAPITPDSEPLAFAPLPRPKPQFTQPLLRKRIVKRAPARRVAARPVAARQTPNALEQLLGGQR